MLGSVSATSNFFEGELVCTHGRIIAGSAPMKELGIISG
jgi:hypothetical protein